MDENRFDRAAEDQLRDLARVFLDGDTAITLDGEAFLALTGAARRSGAQLRQLRATVDDLRRLLDSDCVVDEMSVREVLSRHEVPDAAPQSPTASTLPPVERPDTEEIVARALHAHYWAEGDECFEDWADAPQTFYRDLARAALAAMPGSDTPAGP